MNPIEQDLADRLLAQRLELGNEPFWMTDVRLAQARIEMAGSAQEQEAESGRQ